MAGADEIYLAARRILLDALEALGAHLDGITLVGAQAVYARVGENTDIAIAPTTTDGDIALDPRNLAVWPAIQDLLRGAGFERRRHNPGESPLVGIWEKPALSGYPVSVDLLVPDGFASKRGRRAARLGGHEDGTALKVKGLEACLVDSDLMTISDDGGRSANLKVAGPAALIVAKIFKIIDRPPEAGDRVKDKDALDVFRLLRGIPLEDLVTGANLILGDENSSTPARLAFDKMSEIFGHKNGQGVVMAVRGSEGLISPAELTESMIALTNDLVQGIGGN